METLQAASHTKGAVSSQFTWDLELMRRWQKCFIFSLLLALSQKEEAIGPCFLQHSEEESKVVGLVVRDFGCLRYFSSASLKMREMEMILLFQLSWQRPFLNRHTHRS